VSLNIPLPQTNALGMKIVLYAKGLYKCGYRRTNNKYNCQIHQNEINEKTTAVINMLLKEKNNNIAVILTT
jgi:hypothetical protein